MQPALSDQPLAQEVNSAPNPSLPKRSNGVISWIGVALVVYLCWLLVAPFLPALAFAFALAMLAQPLSAWLLRRLKSENTAALITVVIVCLTLVVPAIFLAQVLVREAMQGMRAISGQDLGQSARNARAQRGVRIVAALARFPSGLADRSRTGGAHDVAMAFDADVVDF